MKIAVLALPPGAPPMNGVARSCVVAVSVIGVPAYNVDVAVGSVPSVV